MTSAPPPLDEDASDSELITAVRDGARPAFGLLYERHRAAAYHLARQLVRSPAEADDLVSEAFARVLDTLLAGGGPDSAFRAYLLTTLRNGFYDKTRRDKRVQLTDDLSDVDPGVPFVDTAVEGLDQTLAARAFARLPERWQTVLWHTEIEGESPAQVAPLLGLTPNGVAALAYRAREGLRQAYLQVHLADTAGEQCRTTVEKLGAWARDGLSKRERTQVDTHIADCARCKALAVELVDVNQGLRGVVAVLVLGSATIPYLAGGGAAKLAALAWAGGTVGAGAAGAAGATVGAASGGSAGGLGSWVGQTLKTPGGQAGAAVIAAAAIAGLVFALSGAPNPMNVAEPPPSPPEQSEPADPADPPVNPPADPPADPDQPPDDPESPAPPAEQNPPAELPGEAPAPPPAEPQPILSPTVEPTSTTLASGGAGVIPIQMTNSGGQNSGPVTASVPQPDGVQVCGVRGAGWSTDANCDSPVGFAAPSFARPGSGGPGITTTGVSVGGYVTDVLAAPGDPGTAVTLNGPDLAPGQSTIAYVRVRVTSSAASEVPLTITVSWPGTDQPGSAQTTTILTVDASDVVPAFSSTGSYSTTSAGNSFLTCESDVFSLQGGGQCPEARTGGGIAPDNGYYTMTNAPSDGQNPSSTADLSVPGDAEVVWAGLYWSASGSVSAGSAQFATPGQSASVAPQTATDLTLSGGYQAYADVTDLVAGGGQYAVTDMPAAIGESNVYAGWALVVVYAQLDAPSQSVMVVDTPVEVGQNQSAYVTLPAAGGSLGTVGLVLWEGDKGTVYTTDTASIGGAVVEDVASSTAAGAVEGPEWNTFGIDVKPEAFVGVPLDDPTVCFETGYDGFTVGVVVVTSS